MEIERGHLLAPFLMMMKGGVPCRTLIDIGSADGTFSLEFLLATGGTGKIFNIDANREYAESLERIRAEVGGGYRICATSAVNGTAFLNQREHEYWRALGDRAEGDNSSIDCLTLDAIAAAGGLEGPFFIKMDIEGAELSALLGAEKTLDQTNGLVLETNIYYGPHSGGKFIDIYSFLVARGFSLFDIQSLGHRNHDGVLFQVYTAYIRNNCDFRQAGKPIEGRRELIELTYRMTERRSLLKKRNDKLMEELRAISRR